MAQSQSDDIDWDAVSKVISSRYREGTMTALNDQPKTPSEIADETDLTVAHVSRALQELLELDMVELLVSESRKKGRIYGTTDYGEPVAEAVADRQ